MDFDAVLLLSFGGPEGPSRFGRSWRTSPGAAACRGTSRPRRRTLPAFRRGVADQRHQPRADRAAAGRPEPARLLRQPQLGALRRRHGEGHTRQRDSACRGVHHLRLERLLQLHAVRRGHRPGAHRGRAGRARTGQAAAVFRPSAVRGDVRRRDADAAAKVPAGARLVFTAHSVPVAADERLGPRLYSRQVAYAARLVAAAAGYAEHDLVWQSRSGPPQVRWLEPDVADHLRALAESGTRAVIVCPIGFVADHIEVVWDLDEELRAQAESAGMLMARASTPNGQPRFGRLAADLIDELRCGRTPARVTGPDQVPGCLASVNGAPCRPPHCAAQATG
nr:RecName: Full=Coproporphyrin III ferrochelatase [Mycobacterium avium]AAC46205.1 ferrochelatase [Mycobacterium avium]